MWGDRSIPTGDFAGALWSFCGVVLEKSYLHTWDAIASATSKETYEKEASSKPRHEQFPLGRRNKNELNAPGT
jgi:hypothetical protein